MNNVLLVQAASKLERLMAGTNGSMLKDSSVAQISAAIYYEAHVMSKMLTSKKMHKMFSTMIFDQIQKDFGEYIDAQARSKPRSLHHIYEWKKVGNSNSRLFKLNMLGEDGFSFRFNYSFLNSKSSVPSEFKKRRHVFVKKAEVMESGNPLVISPKNSERLVFESDGMTVFMPKGQSVFVKRPGGSSVKNAFDLQYSRFFSGNLVNNSIKKSGFQNIFGKFAAKSLRLPNEIKKINYKFSPNAIRTQANFAVDGVGL